MTHLARAIATTATIAILAAGASPALADGTSAGTTITNTATVDYQINGISQTQEIGTGSFTVDRKINVTVARLDTTATSVTPGESDAVVTFTVTNVSNAAVDFDLGVAQSATDDFDLSNVRIFLDDGATPGVFDGSDTQITFLDEIAEDETVTVFVVGDVNVAQTDGQTADVILTADAHEAGGIGTLGAEITASSGGDTAGVDTVLADGAGETDSAAQGDFSALDSYEVSAASLTVLKSSVVISDPVNSTTNPKAIPGATVQYCIAVENAADAATAQSVVVTDTLPADVTYDAGFGIFVNGTYDSGNSSCNADGSSGGSFATGTVTAPLSDIPASTTRTVYFRVTIN
ncbi:hypothetical protein INR77_13225 [Erythrobacter sp. SCSIO 43205]|uniref:hypothetical protein n=1 Tax=Erythrobacter sp. SCSIO 43205 TaxID=2779361 RepID=UPI001CA9F3FE|nr:hypothetical protein [Erythrobacter sp. SCSIO 43205]UAB77731.1 hypothetical protein INR77_13225 [Erythrobacter sp. SCSIO 43205]